MFPNPAFSHLTIVHTKAFAGAIIKILNAEGKQVKEFPVENGAIQTSLNTSKMVKGIYTLVFENSGERTTVKFVKQ